MNVLTRAGRAAMAFGVALAFLLGMPSAAHADGPEQVVHGARIELVSEMSDEASTLSPGARIQWTVGISASGVDDGTISRTLVVDGALAAHVVLSVDACTTAPAAGRCPNATALLRDQSPTVGGTFDLGSQGATDQEWLLVEVTMVADSPASAQNLGGTLRLRAVGAGEGLEITPPGEGSVDGSGAPVTSADEPTVAERLPGPLANTGLDALPWVLSAAALLVFGALMRRRRQPADKDHPQTEGRPSHEPHE
ncbi:hypothetical protein F7P69_06135 [Cellulosimicrobium funkei]|nr:hypothetical protein [Cellulosimicrobium funkei]